MEREMAVEDLLAGLSASLKIQAKVFLIEIAKWIPRRDVFIQEESYNCYSSEG